MAGWAKAGEEGQVAKVVGTLSQRAVAGIFPIGGFGH
jgi:hypothetical protein